jgi:hypothetical protein
VLRGCVFPLNFGAPWRQGSWLCSGHWLLDLGWEAEERALVLLCWPWGKVEGEGSWAAVAAGGMDREEEEGGGVGC